MRQRARQSAAPSDPRAASYEFLLLGLPSRRRYFGAGWRSSAAGSIFRSAARLIFEGSGIGRAADDTKRLSVYLGDVRARLLRLGRFRIDPVKLDLILAGVLAVGSGLE